MKAEKVVNLLKKLNFYNIKKGIKYLQHFGVKEFFIRLSDKHRGQSYILYNVYYSIYINK